MYLYQRNNHWHFRMRTPAHFHDLTQISEIRKSLKTTNKKKALRLALYLYNRLDILLHAYCSTLRLDMVNIEEIKQVIRNYIAEAIIEYSELEDKRHHALHFTDENGKQYHGHSKEAIKRHMAILEDVIATYDLDTLRQEANTILPRTNIPKQYPDTLSPHEQKIFYAELLKGESEILHYDLQRNQERLTAKRLHEEEEADTFKDKILAQFGVNSMLELHQAVAQAQNATTSPINLFSEKAAVFLSVEGKARGWDHKSRGKVTQVLNMAIEIMGDKDLNQYSREDFEDFRAIFQLLPSNVRKKKELAHKTLIEIANENKLSHKYKLLSPSTINTLIGWLNTFFEWCELRGYVNKNYAKSLKIKDTRKKNQGRYPYTQNDIKQIAASLYADIPKLYTKHPERIWIPLIGFFQGMRLEEIAQLHIEDIYQSESGIWVFDLNENPNRHGESIKSIKNNPSIRVVPIHPKLIEFGFLEYFQKAKDEGHERVFFTLKRGRDGFGRNTSDWFNREIKKCLAKPDKKSFHSTRHTFIQRLKDLSGDEHKIKALAGHGEDDMAYAVYGEEFAPEILIEELEKIQYPQFEQLFSSIGEA